MQLSPDLLQQLTDDRINDRQASAAASRIVATTPARMRIAQSLRRAADRLSTSWVATRASVSVGSSDLGRSTAPASRPAPRWCASPAGPWPLLGWYACSDCIRLWRRTVRAARVGIHRRFASRCRR